MVTRVVWKCYFGGEKTIYNFLKYGIPFMSKECCAVVKIWRKIIVWSDELARISMDGKCRESTSICEIGCSCLFKHVYFLHEWLGRQVQVLMKLYLFVCSFFFFFPNFVKNISLWTAHRNNSSGVRDLH